MALDAAPGMSIHLTLKEKVLRVMGALEEAGIPAAVGGALALAYYAQPRTTSDADINLFVSVTEVDAVMEAMDRAGVETSPSKTAESRAREQVRLLFGETFIDLFFPLHAFHESCQRRAVRMEFDGGFLPILSAEDLVVFKVLFNRPKDWFDIESVLETQGALFDGAYVLRWLDDMVGATDSVRVRFGNLLAHRLS